MSSSHPVVWCNYCSSQWSAMWTYSAYSLLHFTSNSEKYWIQSEAGQTAAKSHFSDSTQRSFSIHFEPGFPSDDHSLWRSFARFCPLSLSVKKSAECQAVPLKSRELAASCKASYPVKQEIRLIWNNLSWTNSFWLLLIPVFIFLVFSNNLSVCSSTFLGIEIIARADNASPLLFLSFKAMHCHYFLQSMASQERGQPFPKVTVLHRSQSVLQVQVSSKQMGNFYPS